MPEPSVHYPNNYDDDTSLERVVNNTRYTLAESITSTATSLKVRENIADSIPSTGYLQVDDEIIYYSARSPINKTFTLDARGADGTVAAPHQIGAIVNVTPVIAHDHNILRDAIITIEQALGTMPQGNKPTLADRINAEHDGYGSHSIPYILSADIIIYTVYGYYYARKNSTGSIISSGLSASNVIQNAVSLAGTGASILFLPGTYHILYPVTPEPRQTWWFSQGVVFQPLINNRIFNITSRDWLSFHGTLYIADPSGVTTSAEAIYIDDMALCYFERIVIVNYYRGISMYGTTGGTHENTFVDVYMQVRDRGLNMETACHDNHFLHVWVKGPAPNQWASGDGLRIATGGTQGGNVFNQVEILDMNWGMNLVGAYEVWFGNVIVDNAYALGIYISGAAEGLFFDTIWSSSSGDGIVIGGDPSALPSTYADKIHINKAYCWLNANYGIRFTGYTQQVLISEATVEQNGIGIAFEGQNNHDICINTLYSRNNTKYNVDGGGCGRNTVVKNAFVSEPTYDTDYFTEFWRYDLDDPLTSELVVNGCVDYGTNNPDGWAATGTGATWDTTTYRSGNHSLRLNVNGATAWWQSNWFFVDAGLRYRLRAWVKGTGSTQTFLTIRWWENDNGTGFISEDNIMLNGTYTDWTYIAQEFNAPYNARTADVMFRCPAATTADIYGDDFSVRKMQGGW